MPDATPSNAGDRYHFVYVARRMLDMLPPDSNLTLIQMENLSPADQQLANHPDELLGVDVTEYYDGESFAVASLIEITQVKFSPTHPNETWTLNRLSRNKQSSRSTELPGTSVLRKLANLFVVAYRALEDECREKVRIKFITNQPLHPTLATELESIKAVLEQNADLGDTESGRVLQNLADNGNQTLASLKNTTNLSWKRLSAFLHCWNLSAFDQPMSMAQETEFARLLDQFVDMGIYFGNLINFVQEHAIPNRRTDIRKEQVYGLLRIRESSFFPAPAQFQNSDLLQMTENVDKLLTTIDSTPYSVVLAHGLSGTGKSSTLQLIQQRYTDEKAVFIYDCFGGGQGVGLDTGRFPFKTFFVQIINELASYFQTGLYTTTQIEENEITQRFNLAIKKAAELAKQAGQQLIIAVDAIDDAVEAAREQPNRQDKSFVPDLWRIRWPENCILVVTSRTENNSSLNIKCEYSEVELSGFSEQESLSFLKESWQDANEDLLRYAHRRTNGNPRVLAKLVDSAEYDAPADLQQFIDEQAQHTALSYYSAKVPVVLADNQADWLLLTTLREASQFITITDLATVTGRSPQDVRTVIERLYFGLRIAEDGEIQWPDKDFVSYVRQFTGDHVTQAQTLLADYCLNNFERSEYAERHLSRHLFRAGRYNELVSWWMTEDRLVAKMAASEPHMEDTSEDIQYTLLAAIELQDFKAALQVLILAAEVAQGVDVFSTVARNYPRVVAEQGYVGRLLDHLRRRDDSNNKLMPALFALARAIVEYNNQPEIAKQLFDEGFDVAERVKRDENRDNIWSQESVVDIAVYQAFADGLEKGLQGLDRWKPKDEVAVAYTDLTHAWCQQHDSETAVETIQKQPLNEKQIAYALLGILKAGNITEKTVLMMADKVLESVRKGIIENLGPTRPYSHQPPVHLTKVLDTLIKHGLNQAAVELVSFWTGSSPRSLHSINVEFARYAAYQHFLGVTIVDPDTFELEQDKEEKKPLPEHTQQEIDRENSQARERLRLIFPPQLLRLKALAGVPEEEILQEVDDFLKTWQDYTPPYWYNFFTSDVQNAFGQLVEAVALLSGYNLDVIRKITEVTERLVGSKGYYGLTRYAQILSQHEPYHAEAEKLIYQRLEAIRVPEYSASDAVEALLELYPAASRIDPNLALQIFIRARIEAGSWDSRIDGSAYALLATLQHAQPATLTMKQINELVSIFQLIQKVTEGYDDVFIHLDWLVRLLTTINPQYTFAALFEFDKSDFIDLQDSIEGVALGLLDANLSTEAVYPLTHMVRTAGQGISIFEQATIRLEGEAQNIALAKYAEYIQKETSRNHRDYHTQQMVIWAEQNGFSHHPVVVEIGELATQLAEFKTKDDKEPERLDDFYKPGRDLLAQVEATLANSPQQALQALLEAEPEDLVRIRFEKLCDVLVTLTDRVPSRRVEDILKIIERFNERSYEPKAFSLLSVVAEHASPSERVHAECIETLRRMLTPANLDNLTRWWYREHLDTLLACELLNSQDVLTAFLRATSNALPGLYTNALYRLIGALSRLLSTDESFAIYEMLHARAVAKLPPSSSFSIEPYVTNNLYPSYIRFLADCLGHPDQAKCWLVLYALVDICISLPTEALPLLVDALADDTHSRWMTKRVWLLILFHHLSLRIPKQIVPYLETFVSIALDADFPHAKMRYHAQQVVLQVEAANPGAVNKETLASVEAVNQPKSLVPKDYSNGARDNGEEKSGWSFSWDTEGYWYSRIEEAFGGDRPLVTSMARKWIVERLGFSAEDTTREKDWVLSRKYDDYETTSNDHGSLPRVESFKIYAELHARYLVGGELVDTHPTYVEKWSNQPIWEDYLRYQVRGLDPLLPTRYARPLPTTTANYGVFEVPFEEWVKKGNDFEFEREIWTDEKKDWIVVSGSFEGNASDRDFSVIINSFLVHPETGGSLARLLNLQDDFVALPHAHSPYDSILQELTNDLANRNEQETLFENEIDEDPFLLKGWVVSWHQELPMQKLNPKQEHYGISVEVFAPTFSIEQQLHLDPMTLNWHHKKKGKIGYSEFWTYREGRGRFEKIISGRRLIVHQEYLLDYLRESGLELLVEVRLRRSRPYQSGYKEEETYDHGTVRAFILTADGEVKLNMDQALIERGQALIAEFSEDRATTLQKWMANHIVELMAAVEAAKTEQEAQTANDRCVALITKLWQIQSDNQATKLQQRLWNVKRVPSDDFDYELLNNALKNPQKATDLSSGSLVAILQHVEEAESWLLRLLRITSEIKDDIEDEVIQKYIDRAYAPELVEKLTQVFVGLDGIDITNKDDVHAKVVEALSQLHELRTKLFWKDESNEK